MLVTLLILIDVCCFYFAGEGAIWCLAFGGPLPSTDY